MALCSECAEHKWAPIFCAVLYCYTWTPHGPRLCWVKQVCRWIGALLSLIRYFGSILGGVLDSDRFFNSLSNVLFVHSQWSRYGHIGYIRSKIASENAWANVSWSNYPNALVSDKVNWRYDSMILRWKAMNTGSFLLHLHQDALYWEYKYIIYIYILDILLIWPFPSVCEHPRCTPREQIRSSHCKAMQRWLFPLQWHSATMRRSAAPDGSRWLRHVSATGCVW